MRKSTANQGVARSRQSYNEFNRAQRLGCEAPR